MSKPITPSHQCKPIDPERKEQYAELIVSSCADPECRNLREPRRAFPFDQAAFGGFHWRIRERHKPEKRSGGRWVTGGLTVTARPTVKGRFPAQGLGRVFSGYRSVDSAAGGVQTATYAAPSLDTRTGLSTGPARLRCGPKMSAVVRPSRSRFSTYTSYGYRHSRAAPVNPATPISSATGLPSGSP